MKFDSIKGGILPSIKIVLTHSEKKAERFIGKLGGQEEVEKWREPRSADAKTSIMQYLSTGEVVYIIWMRPCIDWSTSTDAALLAHEATHVAIDYLGGIGESEPSEELMAYTVQCVSEYLIAKHFSWKKKRLAHS